MSSTPTLEEIGQRLADCEYERTTRGCRAAVLVPLLPGKNGYDILFEVRAFDLKRQPGEVCLPGGLLEPGETARAAAVRETCEELHVEPGQIEIIGDMGPVSGLANFPVRAFVGTLEGYEGTFDPSEVDRVVTVPLAWFMEHEPTVYSANLVADMPEDFPWDLIPGGHAYPFRPQTRDTYFYHGTEPLIWGFTAHVLSVLTDMMR